MEARKACFGLFDTAASSASVAVEKAVESVLEWLAVEPHCQGSAKAGLEALTAAGFDKDYAAVPMQRRPLCGR